MARRLRDARPLAPIWRFFRQRDEGAGSITAFVIACAVFVLSTTILIHFVVEPSGKAAGLEVASLKAKGFEALGVLLGTPGYPPQWDATPANVDNVKRLGILEAGSTLRIDPNKFDLLAKGSFLLPSATNGFVDYEEAKRALGLSGYDFHIRASPVFDAFDPTSYGVEGMTDYHIAYIGHWDGAVESEESKSERYTLSRLSPHIKYTNVTRVSTTGVGDAYKDDSDSLRSILVPLLGTQPAQTVINNGAGDCSFWMVNASSYESHFNPLVRSTLSRALVLGEADGDLCYSKNREMRAVLGTANMTGLLTADLTWKEWVDANDAADYGWVEVSPDGGLTWYPLTDAANDRSQDHPGGTQTPADNWRTRSVTLSTLNCGACLNVPELLIALHWKADGTNPSGVGWIVDDVQLAPTTSTAFVKSFERPEFDLLIVGSNVDQNAFTPAEVKNGIRDYVSVYGGRLFVMGGQQNTNWMQPLFHVGIRTASPGVATPDVTHPLLTTPNELAWSQYDHGGTAWDFTGSADAALFNMVIGSGAGEHILSASRTSAFAASGQEGVVMLTTYLPHKMPDDQALRFVANVLMYGRYHYLFMDYGPSVPDGVPVASVTRTAVMDKTRTEDDSYVEIGMQIYIWPGGAGTNDATSTAVPDRPFNVTARGHVGRVYLNWTSPLQIGSAEIAEYVVYRSTAPAMEVYHATLANATYYVPANLGGNFTFEDTSVSPGVTYYYNITAKNAFGQSGSSDEVSATPSNYASAPQGLAATGQAGIVLLSWAEPASTGGSSVSGYRIYRTTDPVAEPEPYTEVGNVLSWQDTGVVAGTTYRYKIAAINSVGAGSTAGPAAASPLSVPQAPVVTSAAGYRQITLTWTVPASPTPVTMYSVHAGNATNTIAWKTNTTLTSWTHTGLNDTETMYYRVTAWNDAGEGPMSAVRSETTIVTPGQPQGVTATNVGAGPGNLTLSWTPPPGTVGITGYTVWAGDSSGAQQNVTFIPGNVGSWMETGLGANRTRYYKVSASNALGPGPNSTEVDARTNGVAYPPTLLATTGTPNNKVNLVITPPAETGGLTILYYKVYRTDHADPFMIGTLNHYDETLLGSGVVDGLVHLQTYKFQVTAVTAAGESSRSNAAQASAS